VVRGIARLHVAEILRLVVGMSRRERSQSDRRDKRPFDDIEDARPARRIEHGVLRDDDWYALKLQEEAGELIAEHLRLTGRGRPKPNDAGGEQARADEAADLFAMVLLYCRHNGIDLEAALARKWFRHLEAAK
jgi:NTP pyrophosphatase (non-canonical NTP hydrolase)